jgi:hypothetical protein
VRSTSARVGAARSQVSLGAPEVPAGGARLPVGAARVAAGTSRGRRRRGHWMGLLQTLPMQVSPAQQSPAPPQS